MQFPEMKSLLRSFQSPKHLLPLLHPTHSLSPQFPPFSRQFFSLNPHLSSSAAPEPDVSNPASTNNNTPRAWSIYDPATTSRLALQKMGRSGEAVRESEPESSGEDDLERERSYGNLRNRTSGNLEKPQVRKKSNLGIGDLVGNRRKGKGGRVSWVCAECGYSDAKWWGTCRSCESVGTMKRFYEVESGGGGGGGGGHVVDRTWLPQNTEELKPMRLRDVNKGISQLDWRIPL